MKRKGREKLFILNNPEALTGTVHLPSSLHIHRIIWKHMPGSGLDPFFPPFPVIGTLSFSFAVAA